MQHRQRLEPGFRGNQRPGPGTEWNNLTIGISEDEKGGVSLSVLHGGRRNLEGAAKGIFDLVRKWNGTAPLSVLAGYIPLPEGVELCWIEMIRRTPLSLVVPTKVRVDFEPEFDGKRVFFRPLLRFVHHDGRAVVFRDCKLAGGSSDRLLLISPDREVLWAVPTTSALTRVIETGAADLSTINGIRKTLPDDGSVELDFHFTSVSVGSPEPSPVLDITEHTNGLTLAVTFIMDGRPFPYNPAQPVRAVMDTGKEISIMHLPINVQRKWFSKAETILGNRTIRKVDALSGYQFSIPGSLYTMLIEIGSDFLGAGFELRKKGEKIRYRRARSVSVKISSGTDWLDLYAGFETDDGLFHNIQLTDEKLDNILLQSKNSFFIIDKTMLERLRRLRFLGMQNDGRIRVPAYNPGVWDEIDEEEAAGHNLKAVRESVLRLRDLSGIEQVSTPEGFHGVLRPYQTAGLSWLWFLTSYALHGCLADDMGLGKTIQALALLQKAYRTGSLERALIITPVSILANWEREIERFTPELGYLRYHGSARSIEEFDGYQIILSSYATVRNDIQDLAVMGFSFVILDEAQAIKNASSQTFKAIRKLKAEHRISLTGTPMENGTMELWSQMDFLLPGLLGSRSLFTERFAKPIEGKRVDAHERTNLLRRLVYPFILRRRKEDVAPDLPEKEEITLSVEMSEDQAAFYERLKKRFRQEIGESLEERGVGGSMINLLEALLRLRQAALFPSLISQEFAGISSCKFDLLKAVLDDLVSEGNKVLVFSQFTGILGIIRDYLVKSNIGHEYLDGSTRDRAGRVAVFQDDPAISVFLVSLKAGGLGLNLTAADYVILFDPWWNPAVERQAIDRAHRIGRTGKVTAYRLIVKGTVEEKIQELKRRKSALTDELIEEEQGFLKSLDSGDIEFLFG